MVAVRKPAAKPVMLRRGLGASQKASKQFYKNTTLFRETVTELNSTYNRFVVISDSAQALPYKVQFHLHELLTEVQELAKENPQLW